jgi:hypothetical protein
MLSRFNQGIAAILADSGWLDELIPLAAASESVRTASGSDRVK